jgi:hypothetical protein
MKQISSYLLFAVAIQSICYAEITKLPAEDRKILENSSRFHEVHSTRDLPPAIVALCVDDKGRLADPGQNWNATDATRIQRSHGSAWFGLKPRERNRSALMATKVDRLVRKAMRQTPLVLDYKNQAAEPHRLPTR